MRSISMVIGLTGVLSLAACSGNGGGDAPSEAADITSGTTYSCAAVSKSNTFQGFDVALGKAPAADLTFTETDGAKLTVGTLATKFDAKYKPRAAKYKNYHRFLGLKTTFPGSTEILVSAALQTGAVKGGLSLRFQGSDGGNTEAYSCSLKKGPPPTPPVVSGAECESAKVSKASAGAFETAAQALEGDFADGMNGEFKLACKAGATPLDVLKGAIAQIDDEPGQFVYKIGQSAIAIDQQEAGTLADGEKAALSAISDADASTKAAVKKHIEALKAASPNAIFGYYGFQQNGCAAPSPGLIVVDPTTGFGVQIDMDPCHE